MYVNSFSCLTISPFFSSLMIHVRLLNEAQLEILAFQVHVMEVVIRVSFREHLSLPVIYGTCKCICTFLIYGCFVCHSRPITCTWSPQQSLSAVMPASCNYYPMHSICKRVNAFGCIFLCVCPKISTSVYAHIGQFFLERPTYCSLIHFICCQRESTESFGECYSSCFYSHNCPLGFPGVF